MSGKCEGEKCNRNGCVGIISEASPINCSCHISPPCSVCTSPRNFCPTCDWQEADDIVINDFVVNVDRKTDTYRYWEPRPLNREKIDWRHISTDTGFTMIKRGCYPKDVTMEDVRKLVNGTFGGRFTKFDNGEFEFIAYTD